MKKNGVPLWQIWVLAASVVIASIVLLILCIITKPSSVSSTSIASMEREDNTEETYSKSAPIIENSVQIASSFPMPDMPKVETEEEEESEENEINVSIIEDNIIEEKKSIASASSLFNIPVAKNSATLIFIFDDAGQSLSKLQKYTNNIAFPFTVAVLPYLPHSKDCALELSKKGKEIMLHQPMQAVNLSINPGPGAISPSMDSYSIEEQLRKNIDSLGVKIAGMNNHEGSLITSDLVKMLDVLQVVKEKGIYFVDSRTTSATKVPQAAQLLGLNIFSNDVFLDNEVERNAILKQIYKGLSVANKNGRVVMIGHIDKSSDIIPKLLSEMYPELRGKGYKFATLSMIK